MARDMHRFTKQNMWGRTMFKRFSKGTITAEAPIKSELKETSTAQNIPRSNTYSNENHLPNFLSHQNEDFSIPPRLFSQEQDKNSFPYGEKLNSKVATPEWSSNCSLQEEKPSPEPLKKEEPETTLGEGVSFKGELHFENFVRINGYFEGALFTQGKIAIGPKGRVKADVHLKEAIVEGILEGNITADRVELRGEAQVHGDIVARNLSVDEGVTIIGQIMITPNEREEELQEVASA
jgi:cytoskeletal protein CcmA (bactofilin family)